VADEIQIKIVEFDERLRLLDRKFSLYITGQEKFPPVRELEELKREFAAFRRKQGSLSAFGQRFLVEGFQQRFSAYRAKWERQLRDVESGRIEPGSPTKTQS
jgi:hypothetical protein